MKKIIYSIFFTLMANISFGQTILNAQNVTKGKCSSCQSTENLFKKNLIIANGITSINTAWAHKNIYMASASIYNNFKFKKGVKYCIKIDFELTKQSVNWNFNQAKFNIRASNHLAPNTGGPTPLPQLSDSELIYEEDYRNTSFSITQQNNIIQNRVYLNSLYINFTPSKDFKQMWFYVTTNGGPTVRFHIKNVDIKQEGAKASAKFFNPKRIEKINNVDVSVLCLDNDLLVDGSGSKCEDGYFVGLSEFNVYTWADIKILHSDWVKPLSQSPNKIKITDFLPKGYQLRPNKIYKFTLAVGIPWDSVDIFFKVDCCTSNLILNEEIQRDRGKMELKQ
jgi:hypothetical protein